MPKKVSRNVDYFEALHLTVCPECGGDIDWEPTPWEYSLSAECCGLKFKLMPTKGKITVWSDE